MGLKTYTLLKISVRVFAAMVSLALIVPIGAEAGGPFGAFIAAICGFLFVAIPGHLTIRRFKPPDPPTTPDDYKWAPNWGTARDRGQRSTESAG